MPITHTTTRLADLRTGDRITRLGDITYRNGGRTVTAPLAPIESGSPVIGVRCGTLAGGVEFVLYPSQVNGLDITFERD